MGKFSDILTFQLILLLNSGVPGFLTTVILSQPVTVHCTPVCLLAWTCSNQSNNSQVGRTRATLSLYEFRGRDNFVQKIYLHFLKSHN